MRSIGCNKINDSDNKNLLEKFTMKYHVFIMYLSPISMVRSRKIGPSIFKIEFNLLKVLGAHSVKESNMEVRFSM